jgi:hypothetical protein
LPIRFEGRAALTGWSLIYPSRSLAAFELPYGTASIKTLLVERQGYFRDELNKLKKYAVGKHAGNNWYTLASMLLDLEIPNDTWLDEWWRTESDNAGETGRKEHLDRLKALLDQARHSELQLGPMPEDLADCLALLSVAGPGICALRMLSSVWSDTGENHGSKAAIIAASLTHFVQQDRVCPDSPEKPAGEEILVADCTLLC